MTLEEETELYGLTELAYFDSKRTLSVDSLIPVEKEEHDKLVTYRDSIERFLYTSFKDLINEKDFKNSNLILLFLGEKYGFKQEVINYYDTVKKLLKTVGYNTENHSVEFAQSFVRYGRKAQTYTGFGTGLTVIATIGVYDTLSQTAALIPASFLFVFMTAWTLYTIGTTSFLKGYSLDKRTLKQDLNEYISLRCRIGRSERKNELKKSENNTIYSITRKNGETLLEKIIETQRRGMIFEDEEHNAVMRMRGINSLLQNAQVKIDELIGLDNQIYAKEREIKNTKYSE